MNDNETQLTEKEISKLRIGDILAKIKDSNARERIQHVEGEFTLSDEDFVDIFSEIITQD